jgi:hypothetical protein
VEIKNSNAEKSAVFAKFHEFLSFTKNNFGQQFPYFPQKTAFFAAKTDSHFIFSEIKN